MEVFIMASFENLKVKQEGIKRETEKSLDLGHTYEINKREYEEIYAEIYNSQMDESEKQGLLSQIAGYHNELQKSYEESVEKTLEEKKILSEQLAFEAQKNLEGVREAFKSMDGFIAHENVDQSSLNAAKRKLLESRKAYEDMKDQMLQEQMLTQQRLQLQKK